MQVINRGTNCTNQTFAVNGILGSVGPWYSGHGTGTFTTTLTHYRTSILGSCVTYGASVKGTLSLTFWMGRRATFGSRGVGKAPYDSLQREEGLWRPWMYGSIARRLGLRAT